jgi:crotonobetainyl-CoA:carnitine CoA-transferase CaiB-like acyl-CoA transferase
VPVVDVITGYLATISVLGALAQRQQDGLGQWLDISMFSSAVAMQHLSFATYFHDKTSADSPRQRRPVFHA